MATRGVETLETFREPDADIEAMSARLRELRLERGDRTPEMPDLSLERQALAEKSEGIWKKTKEAVGKTFDFLVVKPVKWLGEQIKDHPIRTALIALAAFALWYYSTPLSAGLSGIKETGADITSELLEKTIDIDPTEINAFDDIMAG